jgi:hypothetical protein
MIVKKISLTTIFTTLLLLVGCGGGGGGGGSAVVSETVEVSCPGTVPAVQDGVYLSQVGSSDNDRAYAFVKSEEVIAVFRANDDVWGVFSVGAPSPNNPRVRSDCSQFTGLLPKNDTLFTSNERVSISSPVPVLSGNFDSRDGSLLLTLDNLGISTAQGPVGFTRKRFTRLQGKQTLTVPVMTEVYQTVRANGSPLAVTFGADGTIMGNVGSVAGCDLRGTVSPLLLTHLLTCADLPQHAGTEITTDGHYYDAFTASGTSVFFLFTNEASVDSFITNYDRLRPDMPSRPTAP